MAEAGLPVTRTRSWSLLGPVGETVAVAVEAVGLVVGIEIETDCFALRCRSDGVVVQVGWRLRRRLLQVLEVRAVG